MLKVILFVAIIALTGITFADCKCSDKSTAYKHSYEEFHAAFRSEIKSILHSSSSHNQTQFKNTLMEKANSFLEAGSKDCNLTKDARDFSMFIDLVAYSVENTSLIIDLHKPNGFQCTTYLKPNLTACVTDQVKQFKNENQTQYGDLYRKSHFIINSVACSNVKTIQTCMTDTLKEAKCNSLMVDYVNSLFDYIHKIGKCDQVNEKIQPSSGAGSSFAFYSTFAVNAVLCGILIG